MRVVSSLALVVFAGLAGLALAAPQIDADPNREYLVTPEAGKWMICAASFTGPESADLARQLCFKIRSRDNIPAYTFSRSEEQRREQQQEMERLSKTDPRLRNRHWHFRIEEQWAVLIGGSPPWPDINAAAGNLARIKELPLHDLKTGSGRIANEVLVVPTGNTEEERQRGKMQGMILNPLTNAIVIRNPTVPAEVKAPPKFDPLWEKLNADEGYSLLKNPKTWTLVVKEYVGANTIVSAGTPNTGFFDKIFGKNKEGEALGAAGAQAHEVARVLRELKFDAWVMHTRTSSYVTVGSFDSQDDPNMQQLALQISRLKLGPIDLMTQPMPAQVPRPEK